MSRPEFLVEVAVCRYERQKSQTEIVNAMPLYPTEAILWDDNQVPKVHYTGKRQYRSCLSKDSFHYTHLSVQVLHSYVPKLDGM